MRRKDREITDRAEIDAILNEAPVCRIGLADDGDPYGIPVSFGYGDSSIYIHSAHEGKTIALLSKNPRCCFEVDVCDQVIRDDKPCSWEMLYRSVIGFGSAEILTDPEEKRHGFNCIMRHYGGGTHEFSEHDIGSVTVIRIAVESMTGKNHD